MSRVDWLVALLLVSCAGGETHFNRERKAATLRDIAEFCDEWKGWRDRCQKELDDPTFYEGDFYEECKADPRWSLVWDTAISAMERCFNGLSCDGNDDRCIENIVGELGIDPQEDRLFQRCMARADACDGVLGDSCVSILVYYDGAREVIDECVERSCEEFGACLEDPAAFASSLGE